MVMAGTELGRPALMAAWRAGFWPQPAVSTWPRMTSPTCSPAMPVSSIRALITAVPSWSARRLDKPPPKLPTAVRFAARVQQFGLDTRDVPGHVQVQVVQVLGFHVVQVAVLDGSDDGTGGRDAEALAFTVRTAGPAGVDQEYLAAELVNTLHQQLGVNAGRAREEGCAEAGREGGLELGGRAHFGGAHQRGVTTQEVVRSGFAAQYRYRRQNAGHVAGQEDDVRRFTGTVLDHALLDVLQRVGTAGVFGQGNVGVIRLAGFQVDHYVLDDGAETDGVPDDRLVLLAQVDALGVATAFDVEDSAGAPAVLVITNQVTVRVCRQGGLAGAGQAEEQAGFAGFAHVGGAVYWQYVFLRQQEVLHREHGFLHLTGVVHTGQQHLALGKVEDNAAVGVGAVTLGHALEVGGVEDLPFLLVGRVVGVRADEQVAAEQVLPGGFGGHLHRQVVLGVRANVYVRDKLVFFSDVGFNTVPQGVELVGVERAVDRAPVDVVGGAGLLNDKTVHGRPAGALAGGNHQGTVCRKLAFLPCQCCFNQSCCTQITISVAHFDLALGMSS